MKLLGRRAECEALDALLSDALAGTSRVTVLRGEAGVGKTALLEHLTGRVGGWKLVRAVGVESEMELAYSGLHQLCAPLLEHLDRLPVPQREALATVFALSAGPPPDGFLVGLGTLTLLAEAADRQPLVCIVDDAQWLDQASAQILGFVGRRLLAERIAFVCAARASLGDNVLEGLPTFPVGPLATTDARALLLRSLHAPLDEAVCEQIVAESHGNPLALLVLPRSWSAADLAGGFALPDTRPVDGRIEQSFVDQLDELPADARLIVVAAAAEPLGDPGLLRRAVEELDLDLAAADAAVEAGLLRIGGRVEFAHPLVRSAAYRSASTDDRHRVHRALAEASADVDQDRRAWHRARATSGPDEEVASELEQSAGRAQSRGGVAAAAAFLERAAELTLDPALRAARALAAAEAKHLAGAPDTALGILAGVEAGSLDDVQRARVELLRGRIAFGSSHGRDAPPLLLDAAKRLEPHDPELARDTYLDALLAALFVGRLAGDVGIVRVAEAARAAPASSRPRPSDELLDGLALVITEGYPAGAPRLKAAVGAFRTDDLPAADGIRWLWHATHAAHDVWDDESWEILCTRQLQLARQVGALTVLPMALSARIGLHLCAGELDAAASLVEEVAAVTEVTANQLPPYGELALAAWQGREDEATALINEARVDLGPRGEGMGLTLVEHAAAVLYNGLGRYDDACQAAERGAAHPAELAFSNWSLVQLVEAAARTDRAELARDALERLARSTGPSGTDWARGVEARSRALVSAGDAAEGFYQEAIDRLGRTRVRAELARAHLLYGEWLRREGRRLDARERLRAAEGSFTAMGMEAFAARAQRELLATGERARKRIAATRADLTPQEAQIARLARDGLSNPEIGARLFISARTVEWHLRKVFTKLGVNSRRQLRVVLPETVQPVR